MLRSLSLFVGLVILWLLLSGHFDKPLLLVFGFASCVLTVWIARRMDVVDHEAVPYELGWSILTYWIWLFREIAKANILVTRAALSDLSEVRPRIIKITSTQKTELGRVILANSITLTPGTVTINVDGRDLTIHALSEAAASTQALAEMDRRVTRLER